MDKPLNNLLSEGSFLSVIDIILARDQKEACSLREASFPFCRSLQLARALESRGGAWHKPKKKKKRKNYYDPSFAFAGANSLGLACTKREMENVLARAKIINHQFWVSNARRRAVGSWNFPIFLLSFLKFFTKSVSNYQKNKNAKISRSLQNYFLFFQFY